LDNFVPVAKIGDIAPGEHRRVDVGGEPVLLANVDGEFYAVADRCSHEEARLSEGFMMASHIECPLHGSRFDLKTGAVRSSPATAPLRTYETKVEGDDVFIRVPDDIP
jgi:nitrite reductase/ring-hydroxylating ferredoxin subunit